MSEKGGPEGERIPPAKDPEHWLHRLSAKEWIAAALAEMGRAEEAYRANNARAGLAGARRAAGMALNAALVVEPNEAWGRSYMDHIAAVSKDEDVPSTVRDAARLLAESPLPGGTVVGLRSRSGDERILEAAKNVMAHAYARVMHHDPGES
jgi:HEPN domain-containing protein